LTDASRADRRGLDAGRRLVEFLRQEHQLYIEDLDDLCGLDEGRLATYLEEFDAPEVVGLAGDTRLQLAAAWLASEERG
jgi:hypothetical protein